MKKADLLPPQVKMVEYFNEHWYLINPGNVFVPSVTTKLGASPKPFLARWRGDIGNREADLRMYQAADRGTRIHYAWYVLTGGGVVLYNPYLHKIYSDEQIRQIEAEGKEVFILQEQDEVMDLLKLKRWLQIVKPRIIEREKIVASLITEDAGTMDNLMYIEAGSYEVNGLAPLVLPAGHYVFDLKTGSAVDKNDAGAQTATYAKLYQGMTGIECIGTLIVHTSASTKKGIPGLATIYRDKSEMEQDYEYYRLISKVWDHKLAPEKPKLFEFPSMITLGEIATVPTVATQQIQAPPDEALGAVGGEIKNKIAKGKELYNKVTL